MILKFSVGRLNSFISRPQLYIRCVHKYISTMNKVYLRHLTDIDKFELTFKYENPELKVNRSFNFCRNLSESVDSFLSRISTNVEKVVRKKNKVKKNSDQPPTELNIKLYLKDTLVDGGMLCGDIFKPSNDVLLSILDQKYEVLINSPWIEMLTLPNSMLANFPIYPSKFQTVFTNKSLSEFVWSKSKNKQTWIEVGKDFIYQPSNEDINFYLKFGCIPRNENMMEGPLTEVVSSNTVEASPGKCPFDTRHLFTKDRTGGKEFRVVTYNILADLYCDSDYTREHLFPYCPPYALNIDYRKQLILKELMGYNADIICLQEVDRKVFQYDLEPLFIHLGYGSEFTLKADTAEGLAFFYNQNRFKRLDSNRLFFAEHINKHPLFNDIWGKVSKNEKLSERILARTTTLQVNSIESLDSDEILVVANIHLYFHPDSDHIRLLHGAFAIRYLENYIEQLKIKYSDKRVSLIFCGDFNSTPDCGIYKLYTTGYVPKDFKDYQSKEDETVQDLELRQSLRLKSACGTPEYTNFVGSFGGCLDYIYYDTNNITVSQVVPLPSNEEIMENTALPSIVFPSDHIALISDLKWL